MKLNDAMFDALYGSQDEMSADFDIMALMEDEMEPLRILLYTIIDALSEPL